MKRHPFDPISFIFGAVVLAFGLVILSGDGARSFNSWLAPAVIIGLGVLLLTAGWQSSGPSGGDASGDEA